jgi:hypothetical protein
VLWFRSCASASHVCLSRCIQCSTGGRKVSGRAAWFAGFCPRETLVQLRPNPSFPAQSSAPWTNARTLTRSTRFLIQGVQGVRRSQVKLTHPSVYSRIQRSDRGFFLFFALRCFFVRTLRRKSPSFRHGKRFFFLIYQKVQKRWSVFGLFAKVSVGTYY